MEMEFYETSSIDRYIYLEWTISNNRLDHLSSLFIYLPTQSVKRMRKHFASAYIIDDDDDDD